MRQTCQAWSWSVASSDSGSADRGRVRSGQSHGPGDCGGAMPIGAGPLEDLLDLLAVAEADRFSGGVHDQLTDQVAGDLRFIGQEHPLEFGKRRKTSDRRAILSGVSTGSPETGRRTVGRSCQSPFSRLDLCRPGLDNDPASRPSHRSSPAAAPGGSIPDMAGGRNPAWSRCLASCSRIVWAPRRSGSTAGTGGGGGEGWPRIRSMIQAPRSTGEVVVPLAALISTLVWVKSPPWMLSFGNSTLRSATPRTPAGRNDRPGVR